MRKFGRTSQNLRFAGKTEFTHPTPIAALIHALDSLGVEIGVLDYHEHALAGGEDATAAAYVEADVNGEPLWGVGIHSSIITASLRAAS